MSYLRKKWAFPSFFASKGQATVEYILLIAVVIALALAIGGPLGRHLTAFSGALIGPENDGNLSYYGCLTREGLLPGKTYISAANCGQYADLALGHLGDISSGKDFGGGGDLGSGMSPGSGSGMSPGSGPGPGSSSDNSSGSDTEDSDRDSSKNKSSSGKQNKNKRGASRHKAGKKSSHSSIAGSNSGAGEASSEDSSGRNPTFPAISRGKKTNKDKEGKRGNRNQEDDLGGSSFDNNSKGKKRGRRARFKRDGGYLGDRIEIVEEESNQPVFKEEIRGQQSKGSEENQEKKNKLISERKPAKDSKLNDQESGFSFGGFLKFMLIAAIIVAILMIIFSQIMEYQSRE